jgi:hypothetical protein
MAKTKYYIFEQPKTEKEKILESAIELTGDREKAIELLKIFDEIRELY